MRYDYFAWIFFSSHPILVLSLIAQGAPHEFKKSSADQKQKEALGQVRFDKRLAVESGGGRHVDGDVGAFQMTFKMNAAKV
jgi:hypothetical protein